MPSTMKTIVAVKPVQLKYSARQGLRFSVTRIRLFFLHAERFERRAGFWPLINLCRAANEVRHRGDSRDLTSRAWLVRSSTLTSACHSPVRIHGRQCGINASVGAIRVLIRVSQATYTDEHLATARAVTVPTFLAKRIISPRLFCIICIIIFSSSQPGVSSQY